jgi:predicted amidohydrolase YtcJ
VSHLYVILLGGTVVRGAEAPDATGLAWAGDTVLAVGTDAEVRSISRGDSTVVDLDGATVVPLHGGEPAWPTEGRLDIGLPASFAVIASDPRTATAGADLEVMAVVRAGVVVSGAISGLGSSPQRDGGRADLA